MAEIKCPMCSEPNPQDLDVCQFCDARLKPLTDELSRSQPPIRPGTNPTPMDTGELEPVLPKWLRDVRQKSRDSAEEELEQDPEQHDAAQSEGSVDLLAGLQSNAEVDEEIPDWLTGLRGEGDQVVSQEESSEEDDLDTLKSTLGEEPPVSEENDASSLPGWVSNLSESGVKEQSNTDELSAFLTDTSKEVPSQNELQPTASDSDIEWASDFNSDPVSLIDTAEEETPLDTDIPGWLQGTQEKLGNESEIYLSTGLGTDEPAQAPAAFESDEASQVPASDGDTPDWLAALGEQGTGEIPQQETSELAVDGDMPDWMSSLGEESTEEAELQSEPAQLAAEGERPAWLSSPGDESAEIAAQQQEPAQPTTESDTPDSMASAEEESNASAPTTAFVEDESQSAYESETPDWHSSMGGDTTEVEQLADQTETPAFTTGAPAENSSAQSAFVDDDGAPLSTEDVDAIFSLDMPDWLSRVDGKQKGDPPAKVADVQSDDDDLSPANLPSWVQAMRPVGSVISDTFDDSSSQILEKGGPLAGLRGVLPAVPGVGPSSKPKAYSIKLEASEDQQSNAVMLEQILTEEIHPKPIVNRKMILSQRILRWLIMGLLVLVVGVTVYSGIQFNPMPTNVPPETKAFLDDYVQNTLGANAPILLIFDYEAALAGEMEAVAAPFIDYIILQKAPRISIISSTPTGAGLAERFMSLENTQASIYYQAGQQYVNLGYLPGGAAGVLAFAKNPVATKPLSTTGENPWNTSVLLDVRSLSNFAVIILLSTDVESARIWIEQTENDRGNSQFLVFSSAQSGPMILPYFQSGQVDIMVTGLDGSAAIEQANGGRPGLVRRYWDAYGFGLLTAVLMISFGSLWSLVAGWQARRKEQGEG